MKKDVMRSISSTHRTSFLSVVSRLSGLTLSLCLLLGSHQANAENVGVSGKKLLLKSDKMVVISKDPAISIIGSDPIGGAVSSTSFNFGTGPTIEYVQYLSTGLWSTNGTGTLFKYKNVTAPFGDSTLKIAKVKAGTLKIIAKAPPTLPFAVPNGAGTIRVVFSLDGGTNAYCLAFSGNGDGVKFLVKDAEPEPCDDAPCEAGLVCRADTSSIADCHPVGTGTDQGFCGDGGDAPCNPGLVCRPSNLGFSYCDAPGSGAPGAYCGVVGDGPCDPGFLCHSSDGYQAACISVGDGTIFAHCGEVGDAPCDPGLVCRPDPGDYPSCRTAGTGTLGQECGEVGDAPCDPGLLCRSNHVSYSSCSPVGTGMVDDVCGEVGDAPCDPGLACHPTNIVSRCGPAGTGIDGEPCGATGDAPCKVLLGLVCRTDGFYRYCDARGTGTDSEACN